MAIVQHPEHKDLYATDPIARGFEGEVLTVMLDMVGENLSTDGFRCAEVGAGTGGFTRQVSHSAALGFSRRMARRRVQAAQSGQMAGEVPGQELGPGGDD